MVLDKDSQDSIVEVIQSLLLEDTTRRSCFEFSCRLNRYRRYSLARPLGIDFE
jgi:hypothetical protein